MESSGGWLIKATSLDVAWVALAVLLDPVARGDTVHDSQHLIDGSLGHGLVIIWIYSN